jgi:ABC-2 type transport system permease protein
MNVIRDTLVMAKRSLRHTVRSVDTIITVAATPIALMLMFVFVMGNAFNPGNGSYINYITPGIAVMCVVSGIAYAAFRLNNDIQKGIINRFKAMPVAPASILGGHAVSSVLSNLFSVVLVMLVALLAGFRSDAGIVEWLLFGGVLTLFTLAMTWIAIFFGLIAKTAEGAGGFSYILLLLIFISSAFTPTQSMHPSLHWFAEHQPMTPIVETMRSLITSGTAGDSLWIAIAWCVGIFALCYMAAIHAFKRMSA